MCNLASIEGLVLNKNVEAVSRSRGNSGERKMTADKTIKQNHTKKSSHLTSECHTWREKWTTRYSYKRKFQLKAGIETQLVRKLLLAPTRKYNKTVYRNNFPLNNVGWPLMVHNCLGNDCRHHSKKNSGNSMNLPQDHTRGRDSRILWKTETYETAKEKFMYLAGKPLNISWAAMPNI